jgi:hypothetical protein
LEPRRKHALRGAAHRMKTTNKKAKTGGALSLRHISGLIAHGEITVGEKFPMGCIAVAHDGHNSLAMLRRRTGESLTQLLIRLDQAIAKANKEGVFTDEINSTGGSTRGQ